MKFIKSFCLTSLIILVTSCNLDLLDDPNAVKLSATDPSLLLNNIQVDLADFFNRASTFGMQVTRLQNSAGSVYENFANPQGYDLMWAAGYANVLTDCDVLIKRADDNNFRIHAGMARVMQAYTLATLVDYFGDVPFSQAFKGLNGLNPAPDQMVDLYPAVIAILNKAILDLRATPSTLAPIVTDFYYGGGLVGITRWIRLANSIKLKLGLNLRNQNATLGAQIANEALADAAGVMSAQSDSFVFRYGTNILDPDMRHPRFTNNYITGGNDYMSNYLIWQMFYGYDMNDPRMRFYFYRQRAANSADPNEIRCVAQTAPPHYPFSTGTAIVYGPAENDPSRIPPGISASPGAPAWSRTFCFPTPIGYWGREHVDPQGIPPDGLARSSWGPYPAGGRFDANVNAPINNPGLGMRGAGIQPILMRSSVNFMRAEIALTMPLVTGAGTAAAQYNLGVTNSLADVRDYCILGTLGTNAFTPAPTEAITINDFYPTPSGSPLAAVRVATTVNLPALSGLLTIDGVIVANGDRVLVKDQTAGSQNGIYIANAAAWTRSADANTQAGLLGATVSVLEGTANITATFVQITTGTITVGTTGISWRSPLAADITRYVARANAAYASQTTDSNRLNYIAREYWISLFGSGVESYNLYRRTGFPTGMQPTVNPAPGAFPRTFWYPNSFEARNSQVVQKPNLTGKVFWDVAATQLDF
ncbi:MAG: SusD/RagB family nutrient-binding outer membrane lipoprotein [Cyclobacteriaceae bacterium]|nr:SusD/RagB family nutrient-binding outer membrane lipoprotein [Cyclobacteriaceae bacterium]